MKPRHDNNFNKNNEINNTADHWRKQSSQQFNTAISCENSQEKLPWFMQAINTLSQIPTTERTNYDWRDLASYQYEASIIHNEIYANAQQQFIWQESIANTLSCITDPSDNDLRRLAIHQNLAGESCGDSQQAYIWHSKAVHTLSPLMKKKPEPEDWYAWADYQYNAGKTCLDLQKAEQWHIEAIASLSQIQKKDLPFYILSQLAAIQYDIGKKYKTSEEQLDWYKKAIASISQIPAEYRSLADWSHLFIYQNSAGIVCEQASDQQLLMAANRIFSSESPFKKENKFSPQSIGNTYQNNFTIFARQKLVANMKQTTTSNVETQPFILRKN